MAIRMLDYLFILILLIGLCPIGSFFDLFFVDIICLQVIDTELIWFNNSHWYLSMFFKGLNILGLRFFFFPLFLGFKICLNIGHELLKRLILDIFDSFN